MKVLLICEYASHFMYKALIVFAYGSNHWLQDLVFHNGGCKYYWCSLDSKIKRKVNFRYVQVTKTKRAWKKINLLKKCPS